MTTSHQIRKAEDYLRILLAQRIKSNYSLEEGNSGLEETQSGKEITGKENANQDTLKKRMKKNTLTQHITPSIIVNYCN